jgi:hypothetical protein
MLRGCRMRGRCTRGAGAQGIYLFTETYGWRFGDVLRKIEWNGVHVASMSMDMNLIVDVKSVCLFFAMPQFSVLARLLSYLNMSP